MPIATTYDRSLPSGERPRLVYAHIEKTAGSSFIRAVVRPNTKWRHCSGLREYRSVREAECVFGHNPLGFHLLTRHPVAYATMLREPLRRAVSWYYFIRGLRRTDLYHRHPLRDYAESVPVHAFYEDGRFGDWQARYLAGYAYHKAYPLCYRSEVFRAKLLEAAKRNLERCICFGLQSRYAESVEVFQEVFGWTRYEEQPRHASNPGRPRLEEIEEARPHAVASLKQTHALDLALYEHALKLFEQQPGLRDVTILSNGQLEKAAA